MIRYIWLVWVGIVAVACTAVPEEAATVAPTRVMGVVTDTAVPPTPTATNTPETVSSPTPAPMCTPPACTENEVYFCPGECPNGCGTVCATPTPDNMGPAPTTWAELETWLAQAWETGLVSETAVSRLQEAGWIREEAFLFPGYGYWTVIDLDGDAKPEWVFSLHSLLDQLEHSPLFPIGNLWVVAEGGIVYRYYGEVPHGAVEWDYALPQLVGISDMTGDEHPELVVETRVCGAHTCEDSYRILRSVGNDVENIVSRSGSEKAIKGITFEEDLITITFSDIHFEDYQRDGRPDLFVHGGTFGSAGAGEVRTFTEIWSWDGTAVTQIATIYDPTEYRHHILYEANDAFAADDFERAATLYEQTINDDSLITPSSWFRFFNDMDEATKIIQKEIHQFAAFRLVLIALLEDDFDLAQNWLNWLVQQYPDAPFTKAAHTLVDNWNGRDSLFALCAPIASDLNTLVDPELEFPFFLDLGYGNPYVKPGDVCPTEQEE